MMDIDIVDGISQHYYDYLHRNVWLVRSIKPVPINGDSPRLIVNTHRKALTGLLMTLYKLGIERERATHE